MMSLEHPALPFSGATPTSRTASLDGARVAASSAEASRWRYYHWLLENGPATDIDAAEALGMLRTSICARRNELRQLGLVHPAGLVPGRYRARNTAWRALPGRVIR